MSSKSSRGLTWRAKNFVTRFNLRRSLHQTYAFVKGDEYRNPVFVLGVPRSGTTTLFHLLRASNEFASLATEGHDLWRTFHHPRWSGWDSDVVTAADVAPFERRYAHAFLKARSQSNRAAERFVEKTPENSLRIAYLQKMFPDAHFVIVHRNPGDVLNSIITGYPHRHQWCFALIPGWRELRYATIPEIALKQWSSLSEHLIDGRKLISSERWTEIRFEELIASPEMVMADLAEKISIPVTPRLSAAWNEILATPRNSLSAPGVDKWRRDNMREIAELLPRIKDLAAVCGYEITGEGDTISVRPI